MAEQLGRLISTIRQVLPKRTSRNDYSFETCESSSLLKVKSGKEYGCRSCRVKCVERSVAFVLLEPDPEKNLVSRCVIAQETRWSNRQMKVFVFLIVCLASVALADDFKAIDGKEYKNVTVSRVEPDGIVLITKSGISKVYFTELPKEVRARFNYDPEKAAAYSAEQNANLELLGKQQEEARQKLTKERARYWSEHPTPKPRRIFSN